MIKRVFTRTKNHVQKHQKIYEQFLLIGIFIFSLAIRRIGMKHGFPLLTHPDEATIIGPVIKMTNKHSWNPENFNRPDQVLYYLNFVYLNLLSFINYGVNVAKAFGDHTLDFYFYSRFLISILGSFIPLVAYQIGKQFKQSFAFPAALVFALFPLYIEHSVYITPDIPITLFSLLILLFTIRFVKTNSRQYLVFATIFAAINTAEKYPGLISLSIIITGIAIQVFWNGTAETKRKIRLFLSQIAQVVIIFLVSLFIVAPYIFLDYNSVISALIRESRSSHLGADNLGWLGNIWFYAKSFYNNINFFGLILLAVGIFGVLRSKAKSNLLLFYGIFYWLLLSALALHWERWALPMFITPLFLIAIGITTLWQYRKRHALITVSSIVLFLCFFIPQGIHAIYIPVRMKFTDTRIISQQYCQENNITRENSLYEGYSPLLPTNFGAIFTNYTKFEGQYDYIILSSYVYGRYYAEPDQYAEQIELYDEIESNNILLKRFDGYPYAENTLERLENLFYFFKLRLGQTDMIRLGGPTIEIYQVPKGE